MTRADLISLIKGGESLSIEFKSEAKKPLNDRELVEAVICLANQVLSRPAWLVIGVEDDGSITGARPRHGDMTNGDKVAALIAARSRPPLAVRVKQFILEDRSVLVVEIPQKIPHLVGTSDGVFLRRAIGGDGRPACLPMDGFDMQSLQADRGLVDPSAQVITSARWQDLDPLEFERFRRSIRERRGRSDESLLDLNDLELAKALQVVDANGTVHSIRLAALLLFGKQDAITRFLPGHEVAFQVLHNLEVEVNDFFRWPLLRTVEEIEARIRARNREQELMVGILRVGIPDYPEKALREALANALIHRDYQRLGAVHFQWQDHSIEISNPGGFPEGVKLENLLVTAPRPRNPLLADAFKRAGIVERTARGIDTIFFEQLRNGRPAPTYERSDHTTVSVVIPGGQANLEFVKLLVEEARSGHTLRLEELLIFSTLMQHRTLTDDAAAQLLQQTAMVSGEVLHHLLEAGLIEERGQGKGRSWHLSAAAYRALGDKAGYVRQLGFEPLQQEQMVLQFVEKHGRITRKEVAELCKIGIYQATRLLGRLVQEGRLLRHGKLKGSWYERGKS